MIPMPEILQFDIAEEKWARKRIFILKLPKRDFFKVAIKSAVTPENNTMQLMRALAFRFATLVLLQFCKVS